MRKCYYAKQCFLFICISFFSVNSVFSQLVTFAGRHSYLGDNGPATSAGLFNPYAIKIDSAGNIYIATTRDNLVRMVKAATHTIATIAGTKISGFAGDGGPATAAQLNFYNGLPGITVDKKGNIYISDYVNNRIRTIDAKTKIISTIAGNGTAGYTGDGGAATAAELNGPAGIALDEKGNVYFADNNNNVIRRIDVSTKKITTYAGSGVAGYSGDGGAATAAAMVYPECIAFDTRGNLYISDVYNNRIRKVDVSTKKISTVAGNGSYGYSGDGGVATSAALGYAAGIAVDTAGNIYIADQSNNRVRKVTAATKKITTIAGTGTPGYSGDGGLAASAQLRRPSFVDVDKAGNLFIADMGNNRIRKIAANNSKISTVAGDGSDGFTGAPDALQAQLQPQAVALDASGNLYIADGYYFDVREVNIANNSFAYTGAPVPDSNYASKGYSGDGAQAPAATYNAPFGVAVDASGDVYIADVFNNVIRKIAYSSKVVTTVAGTGVAGYSGDNAAATHAMLNKPYGIAVDKNGNLYIADAVNNRIRKITATSQKISTIAGTGSLGSGGDGAAALLAQLNNPTGVAIDTSNNIFILDRGNKRIRMIKASNKKISTVLNNGHVLSGVATDVAGNVFVSDSTAGIVIRLSAKTYKDSLVAGSGTPGYADDASVATLGKLDYPGGLAVSSTGDVYVADINNHVVRRFKPFAVSLAQHLEYFALQRNGTNVQLNWKDGSAAGVKTYYVMRSANGVDFTTIASITASAAITSYNYIDVTAPGGKLYYRIDAQAFNGAISYSSIRSIDGTITSLKMYPNPVSEGRLTIELAEPGTKNVNIYNAAGMLCARLSFAETSKSLSTAAWAKGIYLVTVTMPGKAPVTQKIVVQ